MKIHIQNGRVIDPANGTDRISDIFIADSKIIAYDQPPISFEDAQLIDATNLVVIPGLVDLSARLREPGNEYHATLESEMHAAMVGGVTSLAIPPDTNPVLDEPGLVEMLCHRARKLNRAHIYPVGALTLGLKGERLAEMAELVEAGCVAFSQASKPITDLSVLLRTLQYAATFDFRIWLQAADPHLIRNGFAHEGETAARLGLTSIPACAETIALFSILQLAQRTGTRLHICRLSCADSLPLIRNARQQGMDITCDISINHLHLCDADIGYFNTNCHLSPPLRSANDRAALREALNCGEINALCSDHTPVDDEAKLRPFGESEPGAIGLELLLPLTLLWAKQENIPLLDALTRITTEPARIIGSSQAGRLNIGARADLCLFDPNAQQAITVQNIASKGKNTPFLGTTTTALVRYTIVEGKIMYTA